MTENTKTLALQVKKQAERITGVQIYLTVALAGLKIFEFVDIPWLFVLSPLWIIFFAVFTLVLVKFNTELISSILFFIKTGQVKKNE